MLLLALELALVFHGSLLFSGSFKRTYDAYVHISFADHYRRMWFDSWDERWYTGFTVVSYPRGSQQSIALISHAVGLLNGFVLVQLAAILLVVVGVYRFSRLWVGVEDSGYAALVSVFATSIAETVHVFGQLPTMLSLGFLLNALPYLDRWLRDASVSALSIALAVFAATTATHHLTCIFGTIFFGNQEDTRMTEVPMEDKNSEVDAMIRIDLPSSTRYLYLNVVGAAFKALAERSKYHAPERIWQELELAVHEACVNSVRHAISTHQ